MTSKRAGSGPTDPPADTGDRAVPWGDFQRVLDEMHRLLEGVHLDAGTTAPATAPRGPAVADGGLP